MDSQELDPRFTLANERTFLAWVRTSLALIAGGVALAHLVILRPGWLQTLFSIALVLAGALLCVLGYLHWRSCDRALRADEPLRPPWFALGLVGLVAVSGLVMAVVLALDGR